MARAGFAVLVGLIQFAALGGNNMDFSYEIYREQLLKQPLAAFGGILIVICAAATVHKIRKKYFRKINVEGKIYGIIVWIMVLVSIIVELKSFVNGGFLLLGEDEATQVVARGTIEAIVEPSKRFYFDDAQASGVTFKEGEKNLKRMLHGADITIGGVQYFAETAGSFQVGDAVEISYLPKSHIIMSIRGQ